jgi:hypothetical protein
VTNWTFVLKPHLRIQVKYSGRYLGDTGRAGRLLAETSSTSPMVKRNAEAKSTDLVMENPSQIAAVDGSNSGAEYLSWGQA